MQMKLLFDRSNPVFKEPCHLNRPNIADRGLFNKEIARILDDRWLTNDGRCVRLLEEEIARAHDVAHCVAVCNATIAIQILLKAVGATGEILMPSMTFVATAHAARWIGLTPLFCDIDPVTLTLDPDDVTRRLTEASSTILAVNLFGQASAVPESRLKVLYDSAHVFGGTSGGKKFGGFGDAEVFSFHATKIFNTLEGGAIMTDNESLARECRLIRNFGFSGYDTIEALGTNGKMNEISAAHGLVLLPEIPRIIEHNRTLYLRYRSLLKAVPGISVMEYPAHVGSNYHYVVVFIDEKKFGISRDILYALLWSENILARRYFCPGCHRAEPYVSDPLYQNLSLPVTEKILGDILCLPTGTALGEEDVGRIVEVLAAAHEQADEVRAWWTTRQK